MLYWRKLFSTGYTDPKDHLPNITSTQKSTIVSILSAGTFFGALSAAPMGDILGRRWGLIASTGVFTFGVILQTAATAIPLFVAGRFFAGFGVGLISALSKLAQSQCLTVNVTDRFQSLSTNPKPLPNGSAALSSALTNSPSPSVC